MNYLTLYIKGAEIRIALFLPPHGRTEAHAIIRATDSTMPFSVQSASVEDGVAVAINQLNNVTAREMTPVFRRIFLSDIANQAPLLDNRYECARSIVGQASLDGTKVAQWVWLQEEGDCREIEKGLWINNQYQVWQGDNTELTEGNSASATERSLVALDRSLKRLGGSLADNSLRTWFVVRDIDSNYQGVVKARNAVFTSLGLTQDNHFIASTGIGGYSADPSHVLSFSSFSDMRVKDRDITYIKGLTHLNPTSEYGVAFERATAIDYADRRLVLVSGTASIDNKGCIVAPGDIKAQTMRMLENVEVLLEEAGAGFEDLAHLIVYLRDMADYRVVEEIFKTKFPEVPRIIVHAPVCRPAWLVETECMAIKKIDTRSETNY